MHLRWTWTSQKKKKPGAMISAVQPFLPRLPLPSINRTISLGPTKFIISLTYRSGFNQRFPKYKTHMNKVCRRVWQIHGMHLELIDVTYGFHMFCILCPYYLHMCFIRWAYFWAQVPGPKVWNKCETHMKIPLTEIKNKTWNTRRIQKTRIQVGLYESNGICL